MALADTNTLAISGTVTGNLAGRLHPSAWLAIILLLAMPLIANSFVLIQIIGYAMILGMIALSLMFLGGYGGIVSLAQMTVAGFAGYLVAILGDSAIVQISLKWPWWAAVPVAIMITLAIASAFYYFALQNYAIFNGFSGFNSIKAPVFLGVDWRSNIPFYYLCLACASLSYGAVLYVSRSPFGLALQGTRDNARRMAALGFNVTAHRIAAYSFASVIAALAGVLLVWFQAQISPGTAGVGPVVDILVIAVVGGINRPIGPFIGALVYVLLRTFSIDVLEGVGLDGKRFQLLIGLGFLIIVLFSPDGLVGIFEKLKARYQRRSDAQTASFQPEAPQ
jgi:branched-chain amino acid transport system permease protein